MKRSNIYEYMRTGTTTIGLVCRDGVIMATDTRVTMGSYIAHKKGRKLYPIDRHVAMTIAGIAGYGQSIVELLRVNAKLYFARMGRLIPVDSVAKLASNILFSQRPYVLLVEAIIGGYDDEGAKLFVIDPFGSVTREVYVATGSGSPIALGILESEFKEGLSVNEALPIIVKAIVSAMRRDSASGDSFDIAIIDANGYKELTEDEKRSLLESLGVKVYGGLD